MHKYRHLQPPLLLCVDAATGLYAAFFLENIAVPELAQYSRVAAARSIHNERYFLSGSRAHDGAAIQTVRFTRSRGILQSMTVRA